MSGLPHRRCLHVRGAVAACAALSLATSACSVLIDSALDSRDGGTDAPIDVPETGPTCTEARLTIIAKGLEYGNIVIGSEPFVECVRREIERPPSGLGNYRACLNDPAYQAQAGEKINTALFAARSGNSIAMACGDDTAFEEGRPAAEGMEWLAWLREAELQIALPLCDEATPAPCREHPSPWPISEAAARTWHEAMHAKGYEDGTGGRSPALDRVICGYANDTTWTRSTSAMPGVVARCIEDVLAHSVALCGDIEDCESGELELVSHLEGGTCVCRHDPRGTGIGLVGARANFLRVMEIADVGDTLGPWTLRAQDQFLAHGDFDGDGRSEVIIRGPTSLARVRVVDGRLRAASVIPFGTNVGAWTVAASDQVRGVGDFDGNGRDELVLATSTGLILAEVAPTDVWTTRLAVQLGGVVGGHTLASGDAFHVGDIQGDGHDELLLVSTSGTEKGVVTVLENPIGSTFDALVVWDLAWAGSGWTRSAEDEVLFVADFDDDDRDDFLVRGASGIAVFRYDGGSIALTHARANGMFLSALSGNPWFLQATDRFISIADTNGDDAEDLLVLSETHLGVLSLLGGALRTRSVRLLGMQLEGGWNIGRDDVYLSVGDLDGDPGDELFVKSTWGLGTITFRDNGARPITLTGERYGVLWHGWELHGEDLPHVAGDMDGDGAVDVIIQR